LHFEDSGRIDVDLDEHCAEIIADPDSGTTWITGGGWDRGGLTIRELEIAAPCSSPHPDPVPGTGVLTGVRDHRVRRGGPLGRRRRGTTSLGGPARAAARLLAPWQQAQSDRPDRRPTATAYSCGGGAPMQGSRARG